MEHNGTFCSHNHDCEEQNCVNSWSLYKNIDTPKIRAFNELVLESSKNIFKPWDQRLDFTDFLQSNDDDPELIIFVPFTTDVKIKSICVIGGNENSSPKNMRIFINREDIDFSNVNDVLPVQEWNLAENLNGEIEYSTKYSKFQNISNITFHFSENFGSDFTKIYFIGLKGESTQIRRDVVANVVYEAAPNPADHKVKLESLGSQIL